MTHDIAELDLSVRSFNCLKKGGIHTIEQLKEMSDEELLSLRWFGLRCLNEVHERLKKWDGTPTYDDLKAENAKLREMVKRYHRLVTGTDELWSWQSVYEELQELGIEVVE